MAWIVDIMEARMPHDELMMDLSRMASLTDRENSRYHHDASHHEEWS